MEEKKPTNTDNTMQPLIESGWLVISPAATLELRAMSAVAQQLQPPEDLVPQAVARFHREQGAERAAWYLGHSWSGLASLACGLAVVLALTNWWSSSSRVDTNSSLAGVPAMTASLSMNRVAGLRVPPPVRAGLAISPGSVSSLAHLTSLRAAGIRSSQ